jgi:hypothetical protein
MGTFPQMLQIPVFTGTWQIVSSCSEYPQEPVAIALSIFYTEWTLNFGDHDGKVWKSLNNVLIDWTPRDKKGTAYDIAGKLMHDAHFSGVALSPSMIWVKPKPGKLVCETSLIHELVHVAIWNLKETDGDPDHLGKKYSGWTIDHSALIQNVNDSLCALGV